MIGAGAGKNITTGSQNVFVGRNAGINATTIAGSTFVGYRAGDAVTEGDQNTFLGRNTGFSTTTGENNVFVGNQAGYSNVTGGQNIHIGSNAGLSATGSGNNFMGYAAGQVSTGSFNTFIGHYAGTDNTTGADNVFVGRLAGFVHTEGTDNVIIGSEAGKASTTASNNVFVGKNAGLNTVTTDNNTFIGSGAGILNTAANNTYIGYNAGYSATAGSNNVMLGYQAGYTNTATANTFLGFQAGYSNSTADFGTFVGREAGFNNNTGASNVIIGNRAGYENEDGSSNTFIGVRAGSENVSGDSNVYLGNNAGYYNEGNRNILIGQLAGENLTGGSDNIIIGYDLDAPTVTEQDYLSIGDTIYGDLANDRVAIGVTNPQGTLDLGSGTAGNSIVWGGTNGTAHYNTIGSSYGRSALGFLHGIKLNSAANQYLSSFATMGRSGIVLGENGFNTAGAGDIVFFADASSTIAVDTVVDIDAITRMIIKENGSVGIGTTAPSTGGEQDLEFDVEGDIGAINYCDEIGDDCFTAADIAGLAAGADTDWTDTGSVVYNTTDNIGIGINAPTAKLDVRNAYSGDTMRMQVADGSYGFVEIYSPGNPGSDDGDTPYLSLHRGGDTSWQLGLNGGNFVIANGGGGNTSDLHANQFLTIMESTGHVGIGTAIAPTDDRLSVFHTTSAGTNSQTAVRGYRQTTATANVTSYDKGVVGSASAYSISAGVTDSGYKIGVDAEAFANTAGFAGTLEQSMGVWARSGIFNATSGAQINNAYAVRAEILNNVAGTTIDNAYGVYIDNSGATGTINNRYGVYQVGSSTDNFFQGNVGIGTTTPDDKLDVVGTMQVTDIATFGNDIIGPDNFSVDNDIPAGQVYDNNGGDDAPYTRVTADSFRTNGNDVGTMYMEGRAIDSNAAIYIGHGLAGGQSAQDTWLGPDQELVVDVSANRVGIGTNVPSEALDVVGNINLSGNISNTTDATAPSIVLDSTSSGDTWTSQGVKIRIGEITTSAATAAMNMTYVGNGYGYTGAGAVDNGTNGIPSGGNWGFKYDEKRIVTDSDVVIGSTAAASGSLLLDVEGAIGATQYCDEDGANCFTAASAGGSELVDADNDTKIQVEESADEDTIRFDAGGTEQMIVTDYGSVGIGTNAPWPTTRLHINRDDTSSADIMIENNVNSSSSQIGSLIYKARNSAPTEVEYAKVTGKIDEGSSPAQSGELHFEVSDGGSVATRMMIAGSTVGIGTTIPDDGRLEVKGGSVCVDTNNDDNATSCITSESDERLKKNIKTIQDPLEKIRTIKGVEFDWRWDEYPEVIGRWKAKPHAIGVIAQDVEKVFPEALGEETGDGFKTVEYKYLVAPLIEAVKTLDKQNQDLTTELADLRTQVERLNEISGEQTDKAGFVDLNTFILFLMMSSLFGFCFIQTRQKKK